MFKWCWRTTYKNIHSDQSTDILNMYGFFDKGSNFEIVSEDPLLLIESFKEYLYILENYESIS